MDVLLKVHSSTHKLIQQGMAIILKIMPDKNSTLWRMYIFYRCWPRAVTQRSGVVLWITYLWCSTHLSHVILIQSLFLPNKINPLYYYCTHHADWYGIVQTTGKLLYKRYKRQEWPSRVTTNERRTAWSIPTTPPFNMTRNIVQGGQKHRDLCSYPRAIISVSGETGAARNHHWWSNAEWCLRFEWQDSNCRAQKSTGTERTRD